MHLHRYLLATAVVVFFGARIVGAENSDPGSTGTRRSQGQPSQYGSDPDSPGEAQGAARGRLEDSDMGAGGAESLSEPDINTDTAGAGTGTGTNDNLGRQRGMPDVEGSTNSGDASDMGTSSYGGTGRSR